MLSSGARVKGSDVRVTQGRLAILTVLLHGALKLGDLELILQHLDLVLEQLTHELGHLGRIDFAGLLLAQQHEYFFVLGFKVSVGHAFNLVAA